MNDAIDDDELEAMRAACDAAEPGEWRVLHAADNTTRIIRYPGDPVVSEDSFRFMAKARGYVPRLLRGVRALEEAVRNAWVEAAILRRALFAEREARAADAKRRSDGAMGPEDELHKLARLVEVGAVGRVGRLEELLRQWAGGASINVEGSLDIELKWAEKHKQEQDAIRAEVNAEHEARRVKLREWIDRLEAGDVPEEMRAAIKPRKGAKRSGVQTG